MAREIGEDGTALLDTGVGVALAEHGLLAGLMQAFDENELAPMRRLAQSDPGPAGQHVGKTRHVDPRIAAADAERMQLENLAGGDSR